MAKITIAGDAVVITSTMKLEDLKTIAKYRPKALTLRGGEDGKEPIFSIAVSTPDFPGEISKHGAVFSSATHDADKYATITLGFEGESDEDITDWVADQIGTSIMNLNKLEVTLPAVLEEIEAEKATIKDSISVIQ